MKFYTSHQIALHSSIIDYGFEKSDFSFTKKKGRIIANHNSSDANFAFIERRTSKLDVQKMRVLDEFAYDISINGNEVVQVPSWDVLLDYFNKWLKEIR